MTTKATLGGTNGKAPLGYRNTRRRDAQGRDIAAVEPDPERAPLIQWAFQAYATGNHSVASLRDELARKGLTRPATPKRPEAVPSVSAIHKILTNPYYKGDIVFRGVVYDGQHQALIEPDLWHRVQTVMAAHLDAKDKTQSHTHHLKGTLACGSCGSRLLLVNARSHTGTVYPYFVCAGKHTRRTNCRRRSMPVDRIEEKVEDLYRRVTIPDHVAAALRHLLTTEFDRLHADAKKDKNQAERDRTNLLAERKTLLQAHYTGAVPLDLLKEEQDRIAHQLSLLDTQINATQQVYDDAKHHLDDVLALAGNAHQLYTSLAPADRRLCNQAFFHRILIDETDNAHPDWHHGFEILHDPRIQQLALDTHAGKQKASTDASERLQTVAGLNNHSLVGVTGFEPATSSPETRVVVKCH